MNTKISKSITGTILAIIMITSIFAMVSPTSIATRSDALSHTISKETIEEPGGAVNTSLKFYRGETVYYRYSYTPNSEAVWIYQIDDLYPDGTLVNLYTGNISLAQGGTHSGETQWAIPNDWSNSSINNKIIYYITSQDTGLDDEGTASCQSLVLYNPPEFNFTFEASGCLEVEFDGSATADTGLTIANHTWVFGDGATDGPNSGEPGTVTHTYATCGTKNVKLYGYDSSGVYGEFTDLIDVACGPTAVAVADTSCFELNGSEVTFDGSGSYGGTSPLSYAWTFTGGFTGDNDDGAITKVTVNAPITATLTVTDALNCTDTFELSIGPCSGCSLRLYGTFGEGAGDDTAIDPCTDLPMENWPYTDPIAPFYPQHWQAPRKDFITFNPAMMDHNQGYPELSFTYCDGTDIQREKEKVFKRMWYEKLWFKDHDMDGHWDVVIETASGKYVKTLPLDDGEAIHDELMKGNRIRIWNNDLSINDSNVDLYGPAIVQEFTYFFADEETMPAMIEGGSRVLIPMATLVDTGNGIDSFDADGDGNRDYLIVTSERLLSYEWDRLVDIDGDRVGGCDLPAGYLWRNSEPMDRDGDELSGDETVVLMLPQKTLSIGDELQLFDNKIELTGAFGPDDRSVTILVSDNEDGGSTRSTEVTMEAGDIEYFYRGQQDYPYTDFFVRVVAINWDPATVVVVVGRMFGNTYANIGACPYWNQKAFMVDGVLYEVVAIKAQDNCIKYITFRQKLPKMPIKLYGKHLTVWEPFMTLPEMPPFNENHEVMVDVKPDWPDNPPASQQAKIGIKVPREPLAIDYILEDDEWRYWGQLMEIYAESENSGSLAFNQGFHEEYWELEWFWTLPWQFTEFRLPKDDDYLVTLSWKAPQAEGVLWNHNTTGPAAVLNDGRFKFWYRDCSGPLYIDNGTLRIYGAFDNGPGDHTVKDPETGLYPENKPYTDPEGPFFPQHDQAPHKDFVTFNPAIMDHNQGYPELSFRFCDGLDVQREKEKVFKRMWYEKEWFKDHDQDGDWDLVLDDGSGKTITLFDWMNIPVWKRPAVKEHNNIESINDSNVDIYAPAINQEFTYMFLDEETMPIMVEGGSRVLIPMASQVDNNGIDSFDADGDGERDYLIVTSERLLSFAWRRLVDIDNDKCGGSKLPEGSIGKMAESMDEDGQELSGDETVVLMLPEKTLNIGDELQLFDNRVRLDMIFGPDERQAELTVSSNENAPSTVQNPRSTTVTMAAGDIEYFYRGQDDYPGTNFFVRVVAINWLPDGTGSARLQIGRMFGETFANIGANPYWNQKAFMVDGVFYNVVAIKAWDNCIKYITFRQKLPKEEIKLYGTHLLVWGPDTVLPELPPFNEPHEIMIDVLNYQTQPYSQQDKIGEKEPRDPLEITFKEEDIEERFKGHLKEIYNETFIESVEDEYWNEEWFWTKPWQYTSFVLPPDQLYLVTLAWYAPEACNHVWDGFTNGLEEEPCVLEGSRVKFWYDPLDDTDLYVNRLGALPGPLTIAEHFDRATYGGNGNGQIDLTELVNAILAYLGGEYPFGTGGMFDKADLIDLLQNYIDQNAD